MYGAYDCGFGVVRGLASHWPLLHLGEKLQPLADVPLGIPALEVRIVPDDPFTCIALRVGFRASLQHPSVTKGQVGVPVCQGPPTSFSLTRSTQPSKAQIPSVTHHSTSTMNPTRKPSKIRTQSMVGLDKHRESDLMVNRVEQTLRF